MLDKLAAMRKWVGAQFSGDPIAAILAGHQICDERKVLAIRGLRRAILYGLHPQAALTLLSLILDPAITCPLAEFGKVMLVLDA